jgi:signal transduction histidine kinase
VTVQRIGEHLEVSVGDNGKGLGERSAAEASHFGLMGMRERVEALDGSFHIDSSAGHGVCVRAAIPVAVPQPVALE